jgi:histone H3
VRHNSNKIQRHISLSAARKTKNKKKKHTWLVLTFFSNQSEKFHVWIKKNYFNSCVAMRMKRRTSLHVLALRRAVFFFLLLLHDLSSFTPDPTCKLNVFGHDGNSLGVDSAQVGIFEQTDEIGLAGLLQSHDSRALEAQIGLEVLGDLTDEALEGQFPNEQFRRLLVTTDLSEGHGTGPVTMGLLHSPRRRGTLTSSLGRELFPGGLASGTLPGSLLGPSHVCVSMKETSERVESKTINAQFFRQDKSAKFKV